MKTLRIVLVVNALTSGATGLALAVMSNLFAELFSYPSSTPFLGTGIFLVAYATLVFLESRRKDLSAPWIRFIILLDGLWVAGSLILLMPGVFVVSWVGYAMIGVVGLWVALMGYLQHVGLKKVWSAQ